MLLTKADKPKAPELESTARGVAEALAKHPTAYPEILLTSSETGAGVEALRASVARLVEEG